MWIRRGEFEFDMMNLDLRSEIEFTVVHLKLLYRVFLRPFSHGGGGTSVNGGTHEGDIDLMGGLTLIDYIIN